MPLYSYFYGDRMRSVTTSTGEFELTLTPGAGPWNPITYAAIGLYEVVGTKYFNYCIIHENGVEWESGRGKMDSSGGLSEIMYRYEVFSSSNSNAKVVFTAGSKEVFLTFPANAIRNIQAIGERGGIPGPGEAVKTQTTDANTAYVTRDALLGHREFYVCAYSSSGGAKSKIWKVTVTKLSGDVINRVTVDVIAESPTLTWTATYSTSSDQLQIAGEAATTVTWYIFERVLGRFE